MTVSFLSCLVDFFLLKVIKVYRKQNGVEEYIDIVVNNRNYFFPEFFHNSNLLFE